MVANIQKIFSQFFFAILVFSIIFWLSIFLYGMFYYFYIPAVAHSRQMFLRFDSSCHKGMCSYPSSSVTLVKKGQDRLLARGQSYLVVLELEMPESDVNRKLGMFMVKLDILSARGKIISSSFRSAVLHYKSNLLRYIYTLLLSPFLVSGAAEEKQIIIMPMFENFDEDHENPAHAARVEIHSLNIEIYSVVLRIHAHFTGLRYFMYYWPGTSSFIGISTNFFFLSLIAILSWFRYLFLPERFPDYGDDSPPKPKDYRTTQYKSFKDDSPPKPKDHRKTQSRSPYSASDVSIKTVGFEPTVKPDDSSSSLRARLQMQNAPSVESISSEASKILLNSVLEGPSDISKRTTSDLAESLRQRHKTNK